MSRLSEYVSPDGEYIIPVTWEVFSKVIITGVNNLEEALQVAENYIDDIPLGEGEYVDGSYRIEEAGDENYILSCQEFNLRGGTYFENPKKKD